MTTDKSAEHLRAVIDSIRRNFWLLKTLSDQLIEDLALTASTRAVLEHLFRNGPQTVPSISAAKNVARQSVQELVNELIAAGFAKASPNPRHRRSSQIELTPKGRSVFEKVIGRETPVLLRLCNSLDAKDLKISARTLATIEHQLRELAERKRS